ncbi:hypothetical protein RRG08_054122 [Elysia crispata]|uniref:Uncharacterized protein n=1 Tax=Elysia crispata TaxID=231223 RepID=A0AAE0Y7D7_9GAST|nr:hypothetical protein RRG08_054122 [Elysia crispata]
MGIKKNDLRCREGKTLDQRNAIAWLSVAGRKFNAQGRSLVVSGETQRYNTRELRRFDSASEKEAPEEGHRCSQFGGAMKGLSSRSKSMYEVDLTSAKFGGAIKCFTPLKINGSS